MTAGTIVFLPNGNTIKWQGLFLDFSQWSPAVFGIIFTIYIMETLVTLIGEAVIQNYGR
jgi:hypothetical protein